MKDTFTPIQKLPCGEHVFYYKRQAGEVRMPNDTVATKGFQFNGKYHHGPVTIAEGHYGNKRLAWRILDANTGEPIVTATVNFPECKDARLDDGSHVLIKDWSENEGTLQSLIDAGIVEPTGQGIDCEYVTAYLCRVLK
jgi:hypothetical protein